MLLLHHVQKKTMSTAAIEAKAICQYLTVDAQKALCEKIIAEWPARPPAAGATCLFQEFGENECETLHMEQFHTQSGWKK